MDIHNYEKKYIGMLRCLERAKISDRNKKLISDFNNFLILENISKGRLIRYMWTLKVVAERMNMDLDKANIDDIKAFVASIQQRSDYSPETKKAYKIAIRRFYKWLLNTKDYPEIVSWMKMGFSRCEKRLPSEGDLLTETDIQKLINISDTPRDKAFISVLWESGARVGEIGNLSLNRINFDKHGVVLCVSGKTGSRKIRLLNSVPFLSM